MIAVLARWRLDVELRARTDGSDQMAQTKQVGRRGRRTERVLRSSPTPSLECAPRCVASEPPATGTRAFDPKRPVVATCVKKRLRRPCATRPFRRTLRIPQGTERE